MPDDLLLHLIEPAGWRRALTEGAVRPPSLGSAGFVHLSAPDQVHLPAQALFPGRRDLVLLVVDPGRLTSRSRTGSCPEPAKGEEDGVLSLFGPLPVSAVVAVVPYRPPTPFVLPAPGDALGRTLALLMSLPLRRAVGVGDVPGGVAVLDPDFPHSRDNNRLVLTEPVDAATIEAAADEVGGNAGWRHQTATLLWPDAAGTAAELAARGWTTEELVLMARPAGPVDGGTRAEVVDQREVHDFWAQSWRKQLAGERQRDDMVAQLVGREHLNDRVVAVTDVVVREDGRVVASGQLRVDGATAAVDSVLTEPAARGRGHADAVLARALDLAVEAGCDLVVLEAAADDWPQHWYARRGFEAVGSAWQADRPA
ncbi:GNAT family N-acetyltransferase [Blastococcus sp. CT_GayMR20]|uniref:GNAT family N-acetyltransferase n=1 Tax=Blastococcus sp. CT_GayMR20 TaxID=2559609 RepID=UPI0010743279|nr:GNAT family N-acetyltransferase [Blastococcus sp. CT_GayMR20]TFV83192.1 GNAT family N-acetyltransferase [Blastococcus sp. CT_GayMR20]TFV83197.1 GNAT family N-acetyltransferase [Blastococcus sp. CT_GayMR20]